MPPVKTKTCPSCDKIIGAFAPFCPECGLQQPEMQPRPSAQQRQHTPQPSGRTKLAAGLLAILLGGLGVHKFYLGKPMVGVLYLVFFWTLIPAIVGFIEGCIFLSMTPDQFAKQYG